MQLEDAPAAPPCGDDAGDPALSERTPRMTENSTDVAYRILKEEAVEFRLRPGERINEVEVAARLSMSRAPVREAMNRLIADGLVTFVPKRSFFCRRLSAREVHELYEVRADLEAAAVAAVVAEGDRRAVETVREDWLKAIAATDERDVTALVKLDERFHGDLSALAGNPVRTELLQRINDRIFFIRRVNLDDAARRRASFAEHETLLEAILDGDGARANAVIRRHLTLSAEQARAFVEDGLMRIYAEDVA